MKDKIVIKGASEHNLKHVNLEFKRNQLVVVTGVSGSGKSSLAFDTLYAEGQRRYVESLSAYARQFLGQMEKPKVDYIEGLSPAISIEQKSASKNPRSTVGTVTEIYDYLRVLYARIGDQHCHICGDPVSSLTVDQIVDHIMDNPEKTKLQILAPVVQNRKGTHTDEINNIKAEGFTRVKINGVVRTLDEEIVLDKKSKHTIDVVVDRISIKDSIRSRLSDSIETALKLSEGMLKVDYVEDGREELLSEKNACAKCGIGFEELSPQSFSFNSPIGACPKCKGLGYTLEIDPDLIITNEELSIWEGAIEPYGALGKSKSYAKKTLQQMADTFDFNLKTPWKELKKETKSLILYGSKGKKFTVKWKSKNSQGEYQSTYEGIVRMLSRRMKETSSEAARRYYMRYVSNKPCSECGGSKLKPSSTAVLIDKMSIIDITKMSVEEAFNLYKKMVLTGNKLIIAEEVLKEITNRLSFLMSVGLHYLTLDRRAPTLSGGESQRIRLASQIGSQLVGVMYILDEPSIGLHQRDNDKLIDMLKHLRDLGNTVIVVEHDEDTMKEADEIIDFGPRAGIYGGQVVAQGPLKKILKSKDSITAKYLSGKLKIEVPEKRVLPDDRFISIKNATHNNLKDVSVDLPIGMFVCVTGVSGSGKSSLINQILSPYLHNHFFKSQHKVGRVEEVTGMEHVDKIISIDQQPIGRTPRSNPSTYIKVFDAIRNLFSELPASKLRGYKQGRFSFNVKGGRCEHCGGAGVRQIEMHFMADIYVTCEVCKGRRFNNETLQIKYKGKNISEVLDMDVQEAYEFFKNVPKIADKLKTLLDVGMDYVKLGQPSTTLSGGEAQRIKLARELSKRSTGKTLYLLDEPTTGLHFDDVQKLLKVLKKLVAMGNTIVVIEHNMDVIKTADYIIDLGPEGGDNGGTIVAQGTPEEVAEVAESYTGRYLKPYLNKK
jgi:excinuclease ABC subunit A